MTYHRLHNIASQLAASPEWAALAAALREMPGGGAAVAALAARLLAACQVAPSGDDIGSSNAPGSRSVQAWLAAALQTVTWEKLHSGAWKDVPEVWRDAYTLACILTAALENPQPATAAAAMLRHLDCAALMGGPAYRPVVDAFIDAIMGEQEHKEDEEIQPPGASQAPAACPPLLPSLGENPATPVPLPPRSLGPRGQAIPEEELPSLDDFAARYLGSTPVVISNAMAEWPALQWWRSPEYLLAVAGPRTVPVEVGRSYMEAGWAQQLMLFSELVQRHLLPPAASAEAPGGGGGAELDARSGEGPSGCVYMAQHDLLSQVPALGADVRCPEYTCLGHALRAVNVWIGPAGTVTPPHTDPAQNLLCQVVGMKYVRLYSPQQAQALYPDETSVLTANSSPVDVDSPDEDAYPLFGAAPFVDCILEPGQMLYIPAGWWHYVKSLSTSISVNFWWE